MVSNPPFPYVHPHSTKVPWCATSLSLTCYLLKKDETFGAKHFVLQIPAGHLKANEQNCIDLNFSETVGLCKLLILKTVVPLI